MLKTSNIKPYLLVAPQTLVFLLFLILPIIAIAIVSFWNFNGFAMTPGFTLNNYLGIFTSKVYLATYLNTFKVCGDCMVALLINWLSGGLLSCFPCQKFAMANYFISNLYHSLFDF